MRVAVVGGGIFGCTIAIHLSKAGHEVHLYERSGGILRAASGINQYRLHRGYHYPRSPETAWECRVGLRSFNEDYGKAVVGNERHIYAIAREGSKTSAAQYIAFCNENELAYLPAFPLPHLNPENISFAIEVPEERYDADMLTQVVAKRLKRYVKNTYLNIEPRGDELRRDFDRIVVATYAATNETLRELGCEEETYQFEVCEKPVVRLPSAHPSVVVMDGPFGCVDPIRSMGSALYALGHVEHAIHHRHTGYDCATDIPYLNAGIVEEPENSRYDAFIESLVDYLPALADAEHVGSMFTVRAVLANVDDTDERPTLVEQKDEQVIRVFSGKVPTCVEAARKVVSMVSGRKRPATVLSAA